MAAWIIIIVTIGLQAIFAGARQPTPWEEYPDDCVCHKYKLPPSGRVLLPFCGHEIIERLTAANEPTTNCQADMKYMCTGPHSKGLKLPCQSSAPICTPGGVAYYKVLSPERRIAGVKYNNTILRFCATHEGKTDFETMNVNE